jgi:dihydroorotate dehydrogenase (NAD+) catalytic subunit
VGVDLSVNFGKFALKNPVLAASGTYGYNTEFDVFCDVSKLGAVVTKGITLEPRLGNEGSRVFETYGGLINRIGLENIGIEAFISEKLPTLKARNVGYILNIAGSTLKDYVQLAQICDGAGISAIEVNVSCPNVEHGCLEFGTDAKRLYELVSAIREVYRGFLIVKLTPNVTDIEELACSAEKAGADCISAINTIKGLGVELKFDGKKFRKTLTQGGLSGRCIKPVALSMVKKITSVVKLPVIGIGGVANLQDMLEFFSVGAAAVQVGTENFTHPNVCEKLVSDLENFMNENGFKTLTELKEALVEC